MRHRHLERTARWPRIVTVAALAAATSGVITAGPRPRRPTRRCRRTSTRRITRPISRPNTPSITATAQASGAKYFTLAFLQSTGKNSCSLDWNGNSSQPLNYYASDIAALRAAGGDVIPSFGGYSADHGGTEIADSCTNVQSIAADYEQVITTLGVTRLDMDVESSSLNNTAGITRRNQAIALTEQWAAANGIPLQIQYTIPVEQYGLDPNGEAVLQNAVPTAPP